MAGEILAHMLAEAAGDPNKQADLITGTVTNTSPLTIQLEGSLPISGNFLILSQNVKRMAFKYTVPKVTVRDGSDRSATVRIGTSEATIPNVISRVQPAWVVSNTGDGTAVSTETFIQNIDTESREIRIPGGESSSEFVQSITHTEVTVEEEEREVVLWDDLRVGEQVRMIRAQGGQKYFVIDRA